MKIIELFAGIGAWSKALDNIGVDYETVNAIEYDEFAMQSYNLIHKTSFEATNIIDVSENKLGDCDVIFYSPPCQPFSKGGKMSGFNSDEGKLFFESLRIIKAKQPKFAVMENVSTLQTKFSKELREMLEGLDLAGYKNYVSTIQSSDYGFPQSRIRIFIVSIRKDIDFEYEFPQKEELTDSFVNYLEDDVEKYIHSQKGIDYMNRVTTKNRTHWDFGHHNDTDKQVAHCITANFKKGVPYNVLIDRRNDREIIRKHTPLEVMRLMGFDDKDYQSLKDGGISDSRIYQVGGNSIVVNTLEKLLKNIIYIVDKSNK